MEKLSRKVKTMASSPITSWQVDGEEMEIMTDAIFFGSISSFFLMAESEEELKSLLMKVKEETEIVGLKLNIKN